MLPQELILNIVYRLPTKSIARFRCVSKLWKSLLTQPHFIKLTHHFPSSLFLLSNNSTSFLYTINLTQIHPLPKELTFQGHHFSSRNVNVDTMASCHGIILVKNDENKLLLINPTTKEVQVIPASSLALDPSVSHSLEGFGYDHLSDDYKVVKLSYYDAYYYEDYDDNDPNCNGIFIDVYSVKNGTWKRCGTSPYDHAVGYPTSGVFLNHRIHWLASKGVHKSVIAGFDLGEERFYEVPPPEEVDVGKFVFDRLVEIGGCLCMFSSPVGGGTEVWMMKEYGVGESWSKFRVSDEEKSEFRPVCMVGKEEVVVLKDMDDEFFVQKMVVYDLKERSFRDVEIDGVSDEFCVGGAFIDSLVSPLIDVPQG